MYLKSLQIERFRAFRHMTVSFRYPEAATSGKLKYPNINLLLGNNGMGKSAALKGVHDKKVRRFRRGCRDGRDRPITGSEAGCRLRRSR
jgi:recombinational DNA repair ATPase RecF